MVVIRNRKYEKMIINYCMTKMRVRKHCDLRRKGRHLRAVSANIYIYIYIFLFFLGGAGGGGKSRPEDKSSLLRLVHYFSE